MNKLIVMSGLPASGKSTVGKYIAEKLEYNFFDKDTFLETLYSGYSDYSQELRQTLSRESDKLFKKEVLNSNNDAVVVSFWRHPKLETNSGTPTNWLLDKSDKIIEIHCSCSVDVAVTRFLSRNRHPGHLDNTRTQEQLKLQFEELNRLGPLGLGELIEVDTTKTVNLKKLITSIEKYSMACC